MQESPAAEHTWLEHLVGDWDGECVMRIPGQPDCVSKVRSNTRRVGELWAHTEATGIDGNPFHSVSLIGYDLKASKWVSSFVMSGSSAMWYFQDGELAGNKLTLKTMNNSWMDPSKLILFTDVYEIISHDHKVMRTFSFEDPQNPFEVMTINFHRKK